MTSDEPKTYTTPDVPKSLIGASVMAISPRTGASYGPYTLDSIDPNGLLSFGGGLHEIDEPGWVVYTVGPSHANEVAKRDGDIARRLVRVAEIEDTTVDVIEQRVRTMAKHSSFAMEEILASIEANGWARMAQRFGVLVADEQPSDPVYTPISWTEFREAGMLSLTNTILHVFGLAIVAAHDAKTGEVIKVYPARTVYRGFPREVSERMYVNVTRWMAAKSAELVREVEADEPIAPPTVSPSVPPLTAEQIADLSPGVRDLVVALRKAGFYTTDSGDGSNYEAGMACAVPFRMVAILCQPSQMTDVANRLCAWVREHADDYGLPDWGVYRITAEYNPAEELGFATVVLSQSDPEALDYVESITSKRPTGLW